MITELAITPEALKYGYSKCATFLGITDAEKDGLTLLITPKWIMLVSLAAPYLISEADYPVYLDGFAFAGLINL